MNSLPLLLPFAIAALFGGLLQPYNLFLAAHGAGRSLRDLSLVIGVGQKNRRLMLSLIASALRSISWRVLCLPPEWQLFGTALKGVTSFAAAAAAISGAPIGIAFLVTAAVLTSVAVYSTYKASRNFTSANSDSLEINAQHTAKYLVKEIEAKNKCLTENPGRADGKTWCQVTTERKAVQQQAQSL